MALCPPSPRSTRGACFLQTELGVPLFFWPPVPLWGALVTSPRPSLFLGSIVSARGDQRLA